MIGASIMLTGKREIARTRGSTGLKTLSDDDSNASRVASILMCYIYLVDRSMNLGCFVAGPSSARAGVALIPNRRYSLSSQISSISQCFADQ